MATRQAGYVSDPEHWNFRIACTCPPSTSIVMRGGLMYEYIPDGDGWFVEDDTIDLTDGVQIQDKKFTFTDAGNYLAYILTIEFYNRPTTNIYWPYGDDVEHTTAGAAEQALLDYGYSFWNTQYPLCGLILRNNGTLGTGYNILPIDRINRGRSYLWPADMRPRNIAL